MIRDTDPDETCELPPPVAIPRGQALLQASQALHRLINAVTELELVVVAIARELDAAAARERLQ